MDVHFLLQLINGQCMPLTIFPHFIKANKSKFEKLRMEPEETKDKSEGYTEVFAWGADRYGQLGLGNKQGGRCYCIPRFCTFNVVIRRVACGEEHSAFITNNGSIYTMGSNADGRLGIGDRTVKLASTPCLVEGLSRLNAVEIACGWGHTAAVIDNGEVFTWGVGEYGALGIPDCETQWFPVQVVFPEKSRVIIKNASCGTRHTTMVDEKGRLFVCGAGDAGQLGTGSRERQPQPVCVSSLKETIIQSACGIFHTLALTSTGAVFAMGGNNFGQLGTGTKRSSTVPVPVKGLDKERIVKIAAGYISAAVTQQGSVYVWGTGVFGECLIPAPLAGIKTGIKNIEVGGNFGAAVDVNGVVYTWGSNTSGELGLGDYQTRAQASQVHSLQGKPVSAISCGGSYAIALGRTIPHKYIPPSRAPIRAREPIYEPRPKEGLEKELESAMTPSRVGEGRRYGPFESVTKPRILPEEERGRRTGTSPITQSERRRERQHDELLETYKVEQQRCKELEKRVAELQELTRATESRIRESSIQEPDQKLKDRLIDAETQLAAEQEKCATLLKEVEVEKARLDSSSLEEVSLERKAKELEEMAEEIKRENIRVREDKLAYSTGESTRLSELLKDYEDRIEREIDERRRISREKTHEINALHDEISRVENTITAMQNDKTKLADYYLEEIRKLETEIDLHKKLLDDKMNEKEALIELKKKDESNNELIEGDIVKTNERISDLELIIRKLLEELEEAKHKIFEKENEISAAKDKQEELMSVLQDKELAYSRAMTEAKDLEAANLQDAENLRTALAEKVGFGNELQNVMLAKVVEIDTLNKDVNAWVEVANKTRVENTNLKKNIEDLEGKNRKLMESMNLHMYNRAAEYKERTIKALKASQSPNRIDKLRSSGYKLRHVTPSPERFDKFMEEEKKTTEAGVSSITQLTRFKADTVENIKKAAEGIEQPKGRNGKPAEEKQVSFDGKFVVDQQDYKVEEDPKYVKSNYVLMQMLDEYGRPREEEMKEPVPRDRSVYTTPKRREGYQRPEARTEVREPHRQLIQSTQELIRTLGTAAEPAVYMTPAAAKAKGKVRHLLIKQSFIGFGREERSHYHTFNCRTTYYQAQLPDHCISQLPNLIIERRKESFGTGTKSRRGEVRAWTRRKDRGRGSIVQNERRIQARK
eukprot:TRINITY_DN417_c0_g1_i1.p1 TRINITY_DN417_c0_g1~~TRINITY_DN417_c0_g1_i1.p1  ORF type:complete len:1167 (-),score=122.17 TRINITY_DN417_c0_g1_i1:1806-5306(-)